jgi:hypothetical protein
MNRHLIAHSLTAFRILSAFFALSVSVTLFASDSWSASCSYTNFQIGSEFVAKAGPVSGQYQYSLMSLRCGPAGQIIDGGIGGGGEIDVGWHEPANLESTLKRTFGAAFAEGRVFSSNCKFHLLLVNRRYPASHSIAGVSMAGYPDTTGRTTYENAFPGPLLLPFGAGIPPAASCGCSCGLTRLPWIGSVYGAATEESIRPVRRQPDASRAGLQGPVGNRLCLWRRIARSPSSAITTVKARITSSTPRAAAWATAGATATTCSSTRLQRPISCSCCGMTARYFTSDPAPAAARSGLATPTSSANCKRPPPAGLTTTATTPSRLSMPVAGVSGAPTGMAFPSTTVMALAPTC